jgi:hypothetical protein
MRNLPAADLERTIGSNEPIIFSHGGLLLLLKAKLMKDLDRQPFSVPEGATWLPSPWNMTATFRESRERLDSQVSTPSSAQA